eukprot:CAMPEP_0202820652 /NCGR_PEP_ID=MMETSP1389-20130828/9887_1 /ASSEMBLY_ACC=CAM_ASM_000865 /TAXON_ID=302021 /ORGANISM="Rhodomonas sp., Strain CCMP768" /LENGTH=35 /DNA_ID= /DNA_START= /DNA_END= /DNA_ORIENTATION=
MSPSSSSSELCTVERRLSALSASVPASCPPGATSV